ncbi:cupin-like domain-containing protein (plasmid) [Psychrobium sp. nBUS_13]|uniref:cupin-like domain-containing protein n=1 Tax=Psychrobium sp. nBUS_13 TaxID=3395319 RepID=UPI003EB7EF2E
MKQNTNVQSMLKVLDYTKTNKKWYDDKELYAGYHTVSIQGEEFKGQREPKKRLAKVDYDFTGKKVLDVGCSNGGLLHALADKIELGVGVDFNSKCVNAANALKAINHIDNIHFYSFDLDKEDLSMLNHFIFGETVDVCFFFNISLWVKRWKQVFSLCSEMTTTLLFEAHGSDEQQQEQMNFVKSVYANIRLLSEQSDDDPTYSKRKMYICENKIERKVLGELSENSNFLKVYSEDAVKQSYEEAFKGESVSTINFYPNTHESVVADINNEYIVKFPRPHRGVDGLNAEQGITDLIRNKVQINIPALSIQAEPVIFARYPKIQGQLFDKQRYEKLPEKIKETLASQLASFIASLHAISQDDIEKSSIELAPSWEIQLELIEQQFAKEKDEVINALLPEILKNQHALKIADENKVFGHFDLHGGNVLLNDKHSEFTGVIDFGNCKFGDLHQDLSVMNLSSPALAQKVALAYEQITQRKLNRLLIQHYTTIFYINLLAGLKRNNADDKYAYWLGELHKWYDYLLDERATINLKNRKSVSAIPNNWRQWLAINLMKGAAPVSLQKILREHNFSHVDIATELKLASEHAYIQAGKDIFHTLNKREWLLKTCDTLAALDPRYSTKIEIRETPDFTTFVNNYYSKHLPVVLQKGIEHWPAFKKWTPSYLLEQYGRQEIEVQYGRENDPLYERNSGRHKKKMLMSEFVKLVENGGASNDYYMTANNTKNSLSGIAPLFNDIADFGQGYREQKENSAGAYLWFGPKGTYTPIHHDLTNNMLVQIVGRKKVTLIPALQVPNIYNDKGVFSAAQFPYFDKSKHPLMANLTPVEVILNPGEAIFIPLGWWHTVEALDVSISIVFTDFMVPNHLAAEFPREKN